MNSIKNIIRILTGILALVIAFHLLVFFRIIPFAIVWGGRLKSEEEMYVFEGISIGLNLFLICILSLKAKNVKRKFVDLTLWAFFILFSLNTIGNLFAHTNFEKYFSILTLIFAVLLWKILRTKSNEQPKTDRELH